MLRVKVYEVDENGAEKPYLDNEGNPVVKEGAGLVMATQTAEKVDGKIKADGNMIIMGDINPIAMGKLLKNDKMIRKFMTTAMLHETMNAMNAMLDEDEEETEEEETEE